MSGPAKPDATVLAAFWAAAKHANPQAVRGDKYRVRALGSQRDMMNAILTHVLSGAKQGTFSLPWLTAKEPGTAPVVGDYVILVDFDGKPTALVTTTALDHVTYETVSEVHTGRDGPGVRDLTKWRAIHQPHWTKQLADVGETFAFDMPVIAERFTLLHPKS